MISRCEREHFYEVYEVINDSAKAYRGVIPADRWREPYMTEDELRNQIDEGVQFWSYKLEGQILGVMGIQDKGEVCLIRHAYVRTKFRNKGIGGALLKHLCSLSGKPILIGTWADAHWAVNFYLKQGFRLLPVPAKDFLLQKYWTIPKQQAETSVVLAGHDFEVPVF